MFNNYKKLHEMEQVMASADPASLIREARGGVYPREGKEESQEKAMEVLPETMVTGNEMSGAETGTLESRSNSTDAFQSEQTQQSLETDQESAPETTTAGVSVETTAASAEPANSTPSYKVYVVGEGETLYGICFKEYNNIRKLEEICRINSLTDENSIYAGQKLLLP